MRLNRPLQVNRSLFKGSSTRSFKHILTQLVILLLVTIGYQNVLIGNQYSKKYTPFHFTTQMQLLKPSVPFPGIHEFSYPKGKFFSYIKFKSSDALIMKPVLKNELGTRKYMHYSSEIFVPNEGLSFLSIINQKDFDDLSSQILIKMLKRKLNIDSETAYKKIKPKLPAYYQNIVDKYDHATLIYDKYFPKQYDIDLINFLNRTENSIQKLNDSNFKNSGSKYFNDVGRLTVEKLNMYRRSKYLPDNFSWSESMYLLTVQHSEHMANIRTLTHDGFNERSDYARTLYNFKRSGENLASFQSFSLLSKEEIANKFITQWIGSEPHRLAMEDDFNMCSVGIIKTDNDEFFATMFLIKI